MNIQLALDAAAWDNFLNSQPYPLFLQSWTMGEVYRDIGQEPIRIELREDGKITGICQAIVVPARRGKHLMVQYGPLMNEELRMQNGELMISTMLGALKDEARSHNCSFIRMSPFWPETHPLTTDISTLGAVSSPMHLLSEYTWYIPLKTTDRWEIATPKPMDDGRRTETEILSGMRKTTRNLIGRAEREGVTVTASDKPMDDLEIYFELQKETFKRHHFVPYRDSYIRAQVKHFAPRNQAIVYIARYQNEPVAASVHMSVGGITSYHHGASTHKYSKIPSSYLLQWTAIKEALQRGDDIYNFWGIAPRKTTATGEEVIIDKNHPFAGVTTFKTGFGGKPLPLMHCVDIPLAGSYKFTRAFEFFRKWRRGF